MAADDAEASGKRINRPNDRPRRRSSKKAATSTPVVETPDATESHVRELAALGELMLGAAYADGTKVAVEVIAVAEQLKEFVEAADLPRFVADRLEAFDSKSFSVEETTKQLNLVDDDDRLAVLGLVARVTGADRVFHPGEIAYLKRVAGALGLDPDTVEVSLK